MTDIEKHIFTFTSFEQLRKFLLDCDAFVTSHQELGMEELHPVFSVVADSIMVDLEFIEDCECRHDRAQCINDYNAFFKSYS